MAGRSRTATRFVQALYRYTVAAPLYRAPLGLMEAGSDCVVFGAVAMMGPVDVAVLMRLGLCRSCDEGDGACRDGHTNIAVLVPVVRVFFPVFVPMVMVTVVVIAMAWAMRDGCRNDSANRKSGSQTG